MKTLEKDGKKLEIVKVGSQQIRLHGCSDGLWRWHYYSEGKRKSASAKELSDAKQKARDQLQANLTGRKHFRDLSESDASLFNEWLSTRKGAKSFSEVSDEYLLTREQAKLSEHHLRTLRQDIKLMNESIRGPITSITTDQLEEFLGRMTSGARRRNNVRQVLVSLFRWCRERRHIPDEKTAADLTTKLKEQKKPVTVFTPEEIRAILAACGEEWRPALAIQAFAGVRTEEISRLKWENIKTEKRLIEVTAEAAKTGRRRLVPIHDNLLTFLSSPGEPNELVAPISGMDPLIKRLVRSSVKWKRNALRHSYGSYRCAVIADVPRVAFEMGNSPAMVMKNYNEAQELKVSLEWFNVTNTYPQKIVKTPMQKTG